MVRARRMIAVVGLLSLLVTVSVGAQGGASSMMSAGQGDAVVVADQSEAPAGPESELAGRIAAGDSHTCAVLDNGTVRCWGAGLGRLGYGNVEFIGDDETPASAGPVDLGVGRTAVAIAAGGGHTCALLDDATVRCWGQGEFGQLGYRNTDAIGDDETPGTVGPVKLGAGRTAVAITAGAAHTCALLDDGTVRCWGLGGGGALGYGNDDNIGDNETPGTVGPVDLGAGRTAVAITAGGSHSCALLDDGTVSCWGIGLFGQLGYGNTDTIGDDETPGSVGPVDLGAGRTAVAISAGGDLTCAVLDDRTVRCWGLGVDGALGYGNTDTIGDDETPGSIGPVDLGAGRTAVAITAGSAHTCALLDNGRVRCWGSSNGFFGGQLGYGNTDSIGDDETPGSVGPVRFGARVATTAITAGAVHTCAVLEDATIRCWGFGEGGRLGYGNTENIGDDETPAAVGPVDVGGRVSSLPLASLSRVYVSNRIASGRAAYVVLFSRPDQPVVVGDWDGDGVDGFAARSGNTYTLADEFGTVHTTIGYGKPGDDSYVGDWDGDGTDTLAVRRGNVFYLRNRPGTGKADNVLGYGRAGDDVYVGDWDGNGTDTFAVRRGNVFYLRNRPTSGVADTILGYGKPGDEVLVGDWDGDGTDTFAVRRGNTIYIRNNLRSGVAQTVIGYGTATDQLLVGDYDNDTIDTFAARRAPG